MKLLLTGASGYAGARLFFDLEKKFSIVGTYYDNRLSEKFIHLDVTNPDEVQTVLESHRPDVIIHAAANASGRWCEENPELAVSLNEGSTKSIVRVANDIKAKVVLISSFAAEKPTGVYGKTKLASEEHVKETKAGFITIRPSLIIGFSPNTINDRPFNRILKNLDEQTEAVYDTSWKFQPSYLGHISEIITFIIEHAITNKIIPVAVPELKTRYDIAKDILGAFNVKVKPVDSHDATPTTINDLKQLVALGLPQYSYSEVITKIIDEIKHRELFSKV